MGTNVGGEPEGAWRLELGEIKVMSCWEREAKLNYNQSGFKMSLPQDTPLNIHPKKVPF